MTQYRWITDQAFVGVEPVTHDHTTACQGTYHGRVFVVQFCGGNLGDGWTFVAAFEDREEAIAFMTRCQRYEDDDGTGFTVGQRVFVDDGRSNFHGVYLGLDDNGNARVKSEEDNEIIVGSVDFVEDAREDEEEPEADAENDARRYGNDDHRINPPPFAQQRQEPGTTCRAFGLLPLGKGKGP